MADARGGLNGVVERVEPRVTAVADVAARYGLVIVIGWIGLLKFKEAHPFDVELGV